MYICFIRCLNKQHSLGPPGGSHLAAYTKLARKPISNMVSVFVADLASAVSGMHRFADRCLWGALASGKDDLEAKDRGKCLFQFCFYALVSSGHEFSMQWGKGSFARENVIPWSTRL